MTVLDVVQCFVFGSLMLAIPWSVYLFGRLVTAAESGYRGEGRCRACDRVARLVYVSAGLAVVLLCEACAGEDRP